MGFIFHFFAFLLLKQQLNTVHSNDSGNPVNENQLEEKERGTETHTHAMLQDYQVFF